MRFLSTLVRSMWLRCPRCGKSPLFKPYSFRMYRKCPQCGMNLEREAGFYLGSIYVNYGITSATVLVTYLVMSLGYHATNTTKMVACLTMALLMPVLLFRHAAAFGWAWTFLSTRRWIRHWCRAGKQNSRDSRYPLNHAVRLDLIGSNAGQTGPTNSRRCHMRCVSRHGMRRTHPGFADFVIKIGAEPT